MGCKSSKQDDIIRAFQGGVITDVKHTCFKDGDLIKIPAVLSFTIRKRDKLIRVHLISSSPYFSINGEKALHARPRYAELLEKGIPMKIHSASCVSRGSVILKFSTSSGLTYVITGVERTRVATSKRYL